MSRINVSTIGTVRLVLGLCAVAGRAADAGTDWDQLQQLHPGDKVRVELHGKPDVTRGFRGRHAGDAATGSPAQATDGSQTDGNLPGIPGTAALTRARRGTVDRRGGGVRHRLRPWMGDR